MGHPLIDIERYLNSKDPRDVPGYSIPEAAHYLQLPVATLRSWVLGRNYRVEGGRRTKRFQPVIVLPKGRLKLLSFYNLVDAHVLRALRRGHNLQLDAIRRALAFVTKRIGSEHPLIDQQFLTDGKSLFIERYGQLIEASAEGQLAMHDVLDLHLQRVEYDDRGVAARLYPFTRERDHDAPRRIVIDASISFGRPVLSGTNIPTAVIAERYKAGESISELARDYGREQGEIEEALRCELQIAA